MKTGIELIAEERQRQIEKEGWTKEHDAEHTENQLANAAATYAMDSDCREALTNLIGDCKLSGIPLTWPWDDKYYKPSPNNRIKELIKAGALIAAEIDRLQNEKVKNEKVICPKCLKPVGDCQQYPSYHNRINYICPHCKYDGDSVEFETVYSWHPIHNKTTILKESECEGDLAEKNESKNFE